MTNEEMLQVCLARCPGFKVERVVNNGAHIVRGHGQQFEFSMLDDPRIDCERIVLRNAMTQLMARAEALPTTAVDAAHTESGDKSPKKESRR